MKFNKQNKAIGLDVGQTCVRLLEVTRKSKGFIVSRIECLNIAEEGILDEQELYSDNGIAKWLHELKMEKGVFCLGIPQYLCTTRVVTDFPANSKPEMLDLMVQSETTQLAGLSEESFLSDYQVMTPAFGIDNPVLIGFCRETVANDTYEKCANIGMKLSDMAMSATAAVNAFSEIHPEELDNEDVQLLIDIGTENSTLVIIAKGNILYTGSLMFGAKRFTQVLAHFRQCSEQEAENLKLQVPDIWLNEEDAFLMAARQLETELKTAIDNWRAGEIQELGDKMVSKIWLSGAGAKTEGLVEHLERTYGCPVALYGPTIPQKDAPEAPDPAYTIAFGLALQTSGSARYPLSMATKYMHWFHKKEQNFKYLVTATVVFFLTAIISMIMAYNWMNSRLEELNDGMSELRECNNLVPKLDGAVEQIEHQQVLLIPLVELGGRSKIFARSMEYVNDAMILKPMPAETDAEPPIPDGWLFYVADEFSYATLDAVKEEKPAENKRPEKGIGMFATAPVEAEPRKEEENKIVVNKMPLLSRLIIGGFTPIETLQEKKGNIRIVKYGNLVRVQEKLRHNGFFTDGVDTMVDEWSGRGLDTLNKWNTFLKQLYKTYPNDKTIQHTEFKLVLPLRKLQVEIPPPELVANKKKNVKKK